MVIWCSRPREMQQSAHFFFRSSQNRIGSSAQVSIYCIIHSISWLYSHNGDMMSKTQGNVTKCALFFISVQGGIASSTQGSIYCEIHSSSYFYPHHGNMMFMTQGNATKCALFLDICANRPRIECPSIHVLWNTFSPIALSLPS
jgi:hypothetical protein